MIMEEIERRLRKYLERDRSGIRKCLIRILLDGGKYTTEEIHKKLRGEGYDINIKGVSAMVGLMSARLGILKIEMGEKNKYYMKKEYRDLIERLLEEYDKKDL